MDYSVKTPVEILKRFRQILKEASELYGKPQSKITDKEFMVMSAGRLGEQSMMKCGGFVRLRAYVSPGKKDTETVEFFKRVLANAKK